jgi:molybdopterin biosynthesis enzyme
MMMMYVCMLTLAHVDRKGGQLIERLKEVMQRADVLVTVGGVSLGWEDNLKHALKSALNAEVVFAGIHMKPQ